MKLEIICPAIGSGQLPRKIHFAIARRLLLWLSYKSQGGKTGVVAQLVERLVRNEKVRGSTPLGSTSLRSEQCVERRLPRRSVAKVDWSKPITEMCCEL